MRCFCKQQSKLAQIFIALCIFWSVIFCTSINNTAMHGRLKIKTQENLTTNNHQMIWLLRTVGNSLPPRHDPEQSLKNIEFILKYEIQDPLLHKHWILNRIVDQVFQRRTIELLEHFNTSYSILHFNLQEYAQYKYNAFDHRGRDIVSTVGKYGWTLAQLRSTQRDDKIIHTLNVNGARNLMIQYGRENGARWILPWDQSCYLTTTSWELIRDALTTTTKKNMQYLYTWMVRIHGDNAQVLKKNYKPTPDELHAEPQIIFRNDALEQFDPGMRYGRRDKAAFLVRLNIPGQWDRWYWDSFERPRTYLNRIKKKKNTVPNVGYAIRLNSGKSELEKLQLSFHREMARATALFSFLNHLDARVLTEICHFSPLDLLLFDPKKFRFDHDKSRWVKKVQRENMQKKSVSSISRMIQAFVEKSLLGTLIENAAYFKEPQQYLQTLIREPEDSIVELVLRNRDGYLFWLFFCDSLRLMGKTLKKDVKVSTDEWLRKVLRKLKDVQDEPVKLDASIIMVAGFMNHTESIMFRTDVATIRFQKSTPSLENLVPWVVTAVLLYKVRGIDLWKEHDGLLCTGVRQWVPCCNGSKTETKCKFSKDSRQSFIAKQALLHCDDITPSCRALAQSTIVKSDFPFDLLQFFV